MEDLNKRCPECESIMCHFKYKHNGIDKIGYRCPSPHGLKNTKKDVGVMEFVTTEEVEELA